MTQPYLAELLRILSEQLFQYAWRTAAEIESFMCDFARRHNIEMNSEGTRPLEVVLVSAIKALLVKQDPHADIHTEYLCVGGRADLIVLRPPSYCMVYEFSVLRVGQTKAQQLLGYIDALERWGLQRRCEATLVAIAYEGDSTSRQIEVHGRKIQFVNLYDLLRGLVYSDAAE